MSQIADAGDGGQPDFSLPDEILSVIPTDPYDQLDLARKITSMALASRVSKLEAEVSEMRQKLLEKDRLVYELEDKVSYLDRAYREADSSLRNVLDENAKLTQERDSLALTAKKLGRDFTKLESFKRQLMQSLNDDNPSQIENVGTGTFDLSVPRAYPDESANGFSASHFYSGSVDVGHLNEESIQQAGQGFSLTPQISPRLTPTGTPKIISTSGSPRNYSATSSPKLISGATSPAISHYDVRVSVPSLYSSSQHSSAANSPPRSHSSSGRPRIDGKEFFRQARNRLSYEQFSAFLANIKELNARKQTREETLRKAEEIFRAENKDLYLSFQGLLSRNAH